ncbi:MAG: NADP-dependent oxidoreductase [Alphaproteobacteria bacterium]|nr:MAG: NADP-dependent oxidoreductase [Alphaproteobacteria bacterium]
MRQVVLARSLTSRPCAADFTLIESAMPEVRAGELLLRVVYLSLDPYVGSILRGRHMGEAPPEPGNVIPGRGLGQVLVSKAPGYSAGDYVLAETGWRDHAVVKADCVRRVGTGIAPLSAYLGAAGMPGLTAYAGLHHLAKIRGGENVLISSAAGAVGGTAGQIAKILGASRVIGLAGSDKKCSLTVQNYGFDDCINYRTPDWQDKLRAAFPQGIDVYFDNVGGELLMAALTNLAHYGRIVLCGLASQYHAEERPAGPNPGLYIAKRAQLFGLVVYDFEKEQDAYSEMAGEWIRQRQLVVMEDRVDGLENAPHHFEKLMRGENLGKAIVVVGPEAQ